MMLVTSTKTVLKEPPLPRRPPSPPSPERALGEDERPLEILQEWGSARDQVKFVLRYQVLGAAPGATPPRQQNGKVCVPCAAAYLKC
ncbi:Apoptosis-stimulating of p53 protein 2 [Frankliniella fusca]|uniref:Apoptosis-stimulating of p53 protein 2 n=1 Tax=Frankliniella fusca TaxID=407009 RepID=A0AAE1GYG7_9NEOP|nr:Apoptosis-stimulating of p53 protein 2 [Frankliniella fusca]